MAPDYSKGKIYKIVNDVDDEVYVGSTVQPLCVRFAGHRRDARRKARRCLDHWNEIGWDSVKIILVEDFPCERKEHLEARERHWIETIGTLNKNIPTRSMKEYMKKYYKGNKDRMSDQMKEYREANKEALQEQKKKYYEANKEAILEKSKQQYQDKKSGLQ